MLQKSFLCDLIFFTYFGEEMANAIKSIRNGFKVFDAENYHYRIDYSRKDRQYWKCVVNRCSARITTNRVDSEGPVNIIQKL